MTLYEIIKAVQAAPKKGGHKQAILEQHKDNELLQAYLKAVYDPRITYGVTKLPKVPDAGTHEFSVESVIEPMLSFYATRKLTGKAAQFGLFALLESLNAEGQELLTYLVKRDIVAGIAEGTILDVWPNLFFIPPYQRCAKMDDKAKKRFAALPYFFVQTKSDGQFSYLIKRANGVCESMSRAGSLYPEGFAEKLAYGLPEGTVLAGEMLVHKWEPKAADGNGEWVMFDRKTGNGILNSILSGDGSKFDPDTMAVQYVAWDMLTEAEFVAGKSDRPYEQRLELLADFLDVLDIPTVDLVKSWKVTSIAEAVKIQNEHLARKEEGTVWKEPDLLWRDCQSGDPKMVKAKLVFQADFEIEGVYEGEGKYVGMLGGFNLKSSDGLIKFNVGSGFSDEQRKQFWDAYRLFGIDAFLGRVVAVEGNDIITSEGKTTESIFLPIFIEVREDKKVADTRDEVWQEFNAARGL